MDEITLDEPPTPVLATLGGRVDGREPLTHNSGNAATGGVWRVRGPGGTAILKVARPPRPAGAEPVGSPAWQTSDDPTHWNYWERESIAYRTGFAATVYAGAGITGPALLGSAVRPDGSIALWLADAATGGEPGTRWPVERLAAFARQLGRAQARWAGRVPADGWLSRGWLAQYLADRQVPADVPWDHPAGAGWPAAVREGLRRMWAGRTTLVTVAARAPRTLCHLDVWPTNLFDADGSTMLVDWAFTGDGALGEDIANLVVDSVADGLIDPALLPRINAECVDGYLAGLRDGGWRGSPDAVRLAVAASGAAKYSWLAPAMLARAAAAGDGRGDGRGGSPNYDPHASIAEVFERRAGLLALLVEWATAAGLG